MPEATKNKLLHDIKRSGLIEEDRLQSFLERVVADQGGALPEDPQKLANLLVAENLLTEWQAKKLLAGKAKGFRLGKYKLLGEVGKGGMSSVYLAEHILMRRRVAIKVLPKSRLKDASYLERFRLEARAAAKLDDPHIVRVFDIDNEGDTHYIVMEYVEGQDLHKLVSKEGPLDPDTAADYIAQSATGLAHAHEKHLVHRDIKPANLILDLHGTVKILDLGLAKLLEDDQASLTLANDENVLGTADYLAPEQALNSHTVDHRSDIYSLGCTLYFLLAGRPPFPDGSISERLLKHQVEEPENLYKLRNDLPLSLIDICNKMMSKKPELRQQTSLDVAETLTEWLAERGRKVGGGRVDTTDDESGIGSGIITRFSVGPPGSSAIAGKSSAPQSSETISNSASDRDTDRLNEPSGPSIIDDEDISLAPLEDDEPNSVKAKKSARSSDVLSGSSTEMKPAAASQSGPPTQSLFEEVMSGAETDEVRPRHSGDFDFNPLHPPGYKSSHESSPLPLYLGIGAVFVGILAIIIFAISRL